MIRLFPSTFCGSISSPCSKSMAHRMLICAALCHEPTLFSFDGEMDALGDDIQATIASLKALCADIRSEKEGELLVNPTSLHPFPLLPCKESGSSLRFLLPIVWALGGGQFSGEESLFKRPNQHLLAQLTAHGARIAQETGRISIQGNALGGQFVLPGNVTSQYVSGLLLASPLLTLDVQIHLTSPLQSLPYVKMTMEVMRSFGVRVEHSENDFFVQKGQRYKTQGMYALEGDWSSAAYALGLGALNGDVIMTGLQGDSLQGDRSILTLFKRMGVDVTLEKEGVRVRNQGRLSAIDVDMTDIPDLFPLLCALLMHAKGTSTLRHVERLQWKECDRLQACFHMVRSLGGKATLEGDNMVIYGVANAKGGILPITNDHRMVMAGAIASCRCEKSTIMHDEKAVAKSYPLFFQHYQQLRGKIL